VPRPRLHLIPVPRRARTQCQATGQRSSHASPATPLTLAMIPLTLHTARRRPASVGRACAKRVFEIDMEHCPHCGGRLKIQSPPSRIPRSLPRILTQPQLGARAPRRDPRHGHCPCSSGLITSTPDLVLFGSLAAPRIALGWHSPEPQKLSWTSARWTSARLPAWFRSQTESRRLCSHLGTCLLD
jgi:hypothetical protein